MQRSYYVNTKNISVTSLLGNEVNIPIPSYYSLKHAQYFSIDEVNLSMGELYTVVTNKEVKGKKGAIVAIVARTKAETVINHLQRISSYKRNQVIEITLDMANRMKLIARKVFPKTKQITDRFHVPKLALEAV
jgi:transposase